MSSDERRQGQWKWRRLLIFMTAATCIGLLVWLTWNGTQDGYLHAIIAQGCFWLLGGLVFIYVAGATAQDVVALVKGVRGVSDSSPATQKSDRV